MSEELKPCPFCGSTTVQNYDEPDGYSSVWCDACDAKGPEILDVRSDDKAEFAWNRRAPDLRAIDEAITFLDAASSAEFGLDYTLTWAVERLKEIRAKYAEGK